MAQELSALKLNVSAPKSNSFIAIVKRNDAQIDTEGFLINKVGSGVELEDRFGDQSARADVADREVGVIARCRRRASVIT
jgi:hypothetical protein